MFARLDVFLFNELDMINVSYERSIESNALIGDIHYSSMNYLRYRYPFDMDCTDTIRTAIEGIVSKHFLYRSEIKAISVDLDNTLWHGIAGDGSAEISKDFPSNSNLLLQRVLKQLRERGVFLAITTKNDISTVKETFLRFKERMILSMEDFSSVEAHWQRKSYSILKHSSSLNIGIDSFMHIDDSDLELAEIRSSLPKVELLKFVPEDIDKILNNLILHPRLSKVSLTTSDKLRVDSLKKGDNTSLPFSKTNPIDHSYLRTPEIDLKIVRQDDYLFDFKRSSQLLSKTNQFNTSQETYETLASSSYSSFKIFNLVYSDKNSIQECCSVICAHHDAVQDELVVTSFVLSCRFFARGLEYYFLENVWRRFQVDKLSVLFRRSKKNTPAFEYIRSISHSEDVSTEVGDNDILKISIDTNKLYKQCAKFSKYYAHP